MIPQCGLWQLKGTRVLGLGYGRSCLPTIHCHPQVCGFGKWPCLSCTHHAYRGKQPWWTAIHPLTVKLFRVGFFDICAPSANSLIERLVKAWTRPWVVCQSDNCTDFMQKCASKFTCYYYQIWTMHSSTFKEWKWYWQLPSYPLWMTAVHKYKAWAGMHPSPSPM